MRKLYSLVIALLLAVSLSSGQAKLGGSVKVGGTVKTAANSSGGETNFANDTFTEASDTELSAHTPELGGPWVDHTDSAYGDTASVLASTNRIFINFSTGAAAYYATATPPSADYCTEGVIFVASVTASNASITARMDTATNTMYIFRLNSGTSWDVRKITNPTQTTIGSTSTTNLPSVGESRTMKLCTIGTTISAYVDGVQLSGVGGTDSAITAAGKAGVRFSGTGSTTTGYHFASFRAFTP
jgi:hypothetical protein